MNSLAKSRTVRKPDVECLEDRSGGTPVSGLASAAMLGVGAAVAAGVVAVRHQAARVEAAAPAAETLTAMPPTDLAVDEVFRNLDGGSDAALLQAYQHEQSDDAFATLVERYHTSVYRAADQVLGSSHDAEDVTQMVFLVLAQSQLRMNTPSLGGWLRTVTRNAAIVLLRARRRRHHHERAASQLAGASAHEISPELREEIETALTQLPPALAEAVRLRYLEGWSQKEAARIAGCPRGTISQRAARGIRQLRAILGGAELAAIPL